MNLLTIAILALSLIMFALIYNYIKYNSAKKELKKIKYHIANNCKKSLPNNQIKYDDIAESQKLFLDDLSRFLECNNLPNLLNKKMYEIFCVDSQYINQSKGLKELAYKYKNFYCSNDIFDILYYIDRHYHKYNLEHNNKDSKTLNMKLFGREHIEDEELLNLILNMTLKEFVNRFSLLECNDPSLSAHLSR
jgi:hypothetical protein